jgi:hypothetical protein
MIDELRLRNGRLLITPECCLYTSVLTDMEMFFSSMQSVL